MISVGQIGETYSPAMALAILICRVYFKTASTAELQQYMDNTPVDWKTFNRIITVHQVRPLVYKVLSAQPYNIDKVFFDRLKRESVSIASGNLFKLDELVRLHTQFAENGVNSTPYKGVVLSDLLFGDFITRETADIDFFIAAADFSAARKVLEQHGYKPQYYFNGSFEKFLLGHETELSFARDTPVGKIKVELHWKLMHRMFDTPLPGSLAFTGMQPVKLLGKEMPVLNLQHHLLILLAHHGINDVWRTLRHCIDIAATVQQYQSVIDWDVLHKSLVKIKIEKAAVTGFAICEQIFGIKNPIVEKRIFRTSPILDNLLTFPAMRRSKLSLQNFKQQLRLRDSVTDKFRLIAAYILSGITPNMRDIETLPLPPRLSPLYYILKPFLFLFRRAR